MTKARRHVLDIIDTVDNVRAAFVVGGARSCSEPSTWLARIVLLVGQLRQSCSIYLRQVFLQVNDVSYS